MTIFDIFKKKQPTVPDRYANKPLLRIVDAFVLDAIGELPSDQRQNLEQMTPKLQEVYKSTGSWQDIVIEVMGWDADIGSKIRTLWHKNQGIALSHGVPLPPADFVVMFVDANVAHT